MILIFYEIKHYLKSSYRLIVYQIQKSSVYDLITTKVLKKLSPLAWKVSQILLIPNLIPKKLNLTHRSILIHVSSKFADIRENNAKYNRTNTICDWYN